MFGLEGDGSRCFPPGSDVAFPKVLMVIAFLRAVTLFLVEIVTLSLDEQYDIFCKMT